MLPVCFWSCNLLIALQMTVEFRLHSLAAIAWALRAVDDMFSSIYFVLGALFVCHNDDRIIVRVVDVD